LTTQAYNISVLGHEGEGGVSLNIQLRTTTQISWTPYLHRKSSKISFMDHLIDMFFTLNSSIQYVTLTHTKK